MNVKVILTPSGAGCRHVQVTTMAGKVLEVMSRDEFGRVDDEGDSPLKNRVKAVIRKLLTANPTATPTQIKTAVEAEDF